MKIAVVQTTKVTCSKNGLKALLERWGHPCARYGDQLRRVGRLPRLRAQSRARCRRRQSRVRGQYLLDRQRHGNRLHKVKGIRAGLALNIEMSDWPVCIMMPTFLVMAGKYTPENELEAILKVFLDTPFEGGRHVRPAE